MSSSTKRTAPAGVLGSAGALADGRQGVLLARDLGVLGSPGRWTRSSEPCRTPRPRCLRPVGRRPRRRSSRPRGSCRSVAPGGSSDRGRRLASARTAFRARRRRTSSLGGRDAASGSSIERIRGEPVTQTQIERMADPVTVDEGAVVAGRFVGPRRTTLLEVGLHQRSKARLVETDVDRRLDRSLPDHDERPDTATGSRTSEAMAATTRSLASPGRKWSSMNV